LGIVSTQADRKRLLRARAGRVVAVLIVGVLIVGSMYLYNYMTTSERFAVEHVDLLGIARIDHAEVDRLVADLKGHNILLAPLDVYEARLEAHPRIASVTARRVLPDRVVYDIVEREPVALVFTDRYYEIGSDGVVMAGDAYTGLLDLPTITGVSARDVKPGRVCTDPMVRGAIDALQVCRQIGRGFAEDISEVRASDAGLSIRSLKEDCVLLVGNADFEKRLRKFFLLKDELVRRDGASGLIDLRFDNQVVLRNEI
jgi:cell division protein FtsQ